MPKSPSKKSGKSIETLKHGEASRRNIPTAEYQSVMAKEEQSPIRVAFERRNRDLDPQLAWRGKDDKNWADLVVSAPPIFIQEKIHPKVLIDDLLRRTQADVKASASQIDLFADFNGLPSESAKTEFYQHDANWSNRMILGDSLQVMASLAEREGLRGKVQCIYVDPPYGIRFNSNFQWSTTSRDVKDGSTDHITREPEQVKAFRDTWRDGVHTYLTYLRDRFSVARELLTPSGSMFVQIGDENIHRVRAVLDEVFGDTNCVAQIAFKTTDPLGQTGIAKVYDYLLWYAADIAALKFRPIFRERDIQDDTEYRFFDAALSSRPVERASAEFKDTVYRRRNATSSGYTKSCTFDLPLFGRTFPPPGKKSWSSNPEGMARLAKADRLFVLGKDPYYKQYHRDFPLSQLENCWTDKPAAQAKQYVVQTAEKFVQRCLLMATDPGDLVLDPTCGSGTTAYVAEQWGRRWITIDTSRVALALARARIMGARYSYYLLADSREGRLKEAEVSRSAVSDVQTRGDIRLGFVCERVPHVTLQLIANDAEIDVIWDKYQQKLEPSRLSLNKALHRSWDEWEIPREQGEEWSAEAKRLHAQWWAERLARQREIDASIAAKAKREFLYDRPYEDPGKVRVAGPFTVETLSPHRMLGVDEDDELIDGVADTPPLHGEGHDFATMILDNLRTAGVQQAHKEDKIVFASLVPWPGKFVCAEGVYVETAQEITKQKRAAIFVGPEFGTVSRQDLVVAAREAGDADFDLLIACAFSYDAHSSEFSKLGRIPILKARMNADLQMADDFKNTGKGNLFVIFGEPDIKILPADADTGGLSVRDAKQIKLKINGVDVFHPNTGEVRSDGAEGIACWFIDTDYNEESFFVRHAYFLGTNDPYKALRTTLKAEINKEAWETLHSDTSRPFDKPKSGRIAVKVINHLGDEVMKVFRVE